MLPDSLRFSNARIWGCGLECPGSNDLGRAFGVCVLRVRRLNFSGA
jgi:predicted NAD-dependent protein-ADP-ribosyltransferase YbiA (DUF1768 family)